MFWQRLRFRFSPPPGLSVQGSLHWFLPSFTYPISSAACMLVFSWPLSDGRRSRNVRAWTVRRGIVAFDPDVLAQVITQFLLRFVCVQISTGSIWNYRLSTLVTREQRQARWYGSIVMRTLCKTYKYQSNVGLVSSSSSPFFCSLHSHPHLLLLYPLVVSVVSTLFPTRSS